MLKLKDISEKEVVYFRDTNCVYYWDFKYVVDVDENHFALINHSGSGSGWEVEQMEFVDKEFVFPFFKNSGWDEEFKKIKGEKLGEHIDCELINEDGDYYGDEEVILIEKEFVLSKMKEVEGTYDE